MYHLCAFTEAIGATANTDVAALSDDVFPITNEHFQIPKDLKVLMAWAGSATHIRSRMNSPQLRANNGRYIRPTETAVIPAARPNVDFMGLNPVELFEGEELAIEATANPGTTERFTAVLAIGDGIDPVPPGKLLTFRATSSGAAVANAWSSIALTLDVAFPAGQYALVGSEVISTNAIAHRWILDNQLFRPGFLSATADGNRTSDVLYQRQLGTFGRFRHTSVPRLQVLCNGTDNSHTVFIHAVRLGN